MVEVIGFWEGVIEVRILGVKNIIIEGDNLIGIKVLRGECMCLWKIENLIYIRKDYYFYNNLKVIRCLYINIWVILFWIMYLE